jgi:hypothetical protein
MAVVVMEETSKEKDRELFLRSLSGIWRLAEHVMG